VYQHNGQEVEFDAEHFPADFNDSAYTFLRRYDKLKARNKIEKLPQ
jgi:hypothetical protein